MAPCLLNYTQREKCQSGTSFPLYVIIQFTTHVYQMHVKDTKYSFAAHRFLQEAPTIDIIFIGAWIFDVFCQHSLLYQIVVFMLRARLHISHNVIQINFVFTPNIISTIFIGYILADFFLTLQLLHSLIRRCLFDRFDSANCIYLERWAVRN